MKTDRSKFALVITGALIFNIIFWKEKPGVNTILFDFFICAAVFYLYPYSLRNSACKWLLAGHLLATSMVVVQNTLLSEISFSVTLLLFISFSQYLHRSAWYAGASAILNYILVIPNFFREINFSKGKPAGWRGLSKPIRILLIPVLIAIVFFTIYAFANTIFSNIASDAFTAIESWVAACF